MNSQEMCQTPSGAHPEPSRRSCHAQSCRRTGGWGHSQPLKWGLRNQALDMEKLQEKNALRASQIHVVSYVFPQKWQCFLTTSGHLDCGFHGQAVLAALARDIPALLNSIPKSPELTIQTFIIRGSSQSHKTSLCQKKHIQIYSHATKYHKAMFSHWHFSVFQEPPSCSARALRWLPSRGRWSKVLVNLFLGGFCYIFPYKTMTLDEGYLDFLDVDFVIWFGMLIIQIWDLNLSGWASR